jgi:hypothetical protein
MIETLVYGGGDYIYSRARIAGNKSFCRYHACHKRILLPARSIKSSIILLFQQIKQIYNVLIYKAKSITVKTMYVIIIIIGKMIAWINDLYVCVYVAQ